MPEPTQPHPPRGPAASVPLETLLSKHFGFSAFHPGQREPIETILNGGDAVVVMPTGSGKSLCYQLPALALEGITLVVSPLISLMKDQVDSLVTRGIPATCLNSSISMEETAARVGALRRGETRLVYVAPERFRNTRFQALLSDLKVSLVAVDESHCISQWGHDFRPDYLRLGGMIQALPQARIMALTATATPAVRDDIVKQLGLGVGTRPAPRVFVRGFRRDNLRLVVEPCRSHAHKLERIRRILSDFPTGIVYCSTRKQVERVGKLLGELKIKHMVYHAGLPDNQRTLAQDRFMKGDVPVVVATNAFGMGVDRSDLRFVIHWDIPGSIEAYYQEVGRAGRDGSLAHCELLYNYADVSTQQFFLDGSNPDPKLVLTLWDEVRAILAAQPQTCSLEAWGDQVMATDNKVTVHTCMGLFDRAGLIERTVESGNRCYTTALAKDGDPARLRALLPTIEEKRRRDQQKLDVMVSYVHSRQCRHRFIMDYFGEIAPKSAACGHCDYCGFSAAIPPRPPTENEWLVLQKLLSCVGRLNGRFGRATLIAFAAGAPDPAITIHGLAQTPAYGILRDEPRTYLLALFEALITAEALALGPAPDRTVALTPFGREVAWRRQTPSLLWPKRTVSEAPAFTPREAQPRRKKPHRKESTPRRAAQPTDDRVLSAQEDRIFDALKSWRREEAALSEVPGFTIFSNRTLKSIVLRKPDSLAALEEVHGVGPAKLEAYGDTILKLLDRFRT
ncbi:MAG: RecQ family ATP-dependent DNA helicase [bacterium]